MGHVALRGLCALCFVLRGYEGILKLRVFCSCAMLMASFVIGSAPGTRTIPRNVPVPGALPITNEAMSIAQEQNTRSFKMPSYPLKTKHSAHKPRSATWPILPDFSKDQVWR